MGTRELLILILGLAVVAVILRGLYVALHARRSQIRLAIDKNIPQDLDLEELENSELPNGGARVVRRSLDAVNQQNALQNELDLGLETQAEEAVPILLDPVEIKHRALREETDSAEEYPDDEVDHNTDAAALDADKGPDSGETVEDDFYDSYSDEQELFEESTHNEVAQDEEGDYEEFASEEESEEEPIYEERVDLDSAYEEGEEEIFQTESAVDHEEDSKCESEYESEYESEDGSRQEPDFGRDGLLDEEFDDFSMTAGERIGAPESSSSRGRERKGRFGGAGERAGKGSLFGRFGRKSSDSDADETASSNAHGHFSTEEADPDHRVVAGPASTVSESGTPGAELFEQEQDQEELAGAPEKNEVADINRARESRRSVSNNGAAQSSGTEPSEPAEVLVVNVMSREDELFAGRDLLQVLISAGLKHGDMNIFHKHLHNDPESPAIFSVANILNPGTFDLDAMDDFSTRGISLFLAMPAVISNRDAFEEMLRTAQQIRAALDGELRDDHRSVMTPQTIEHYRQRIHDYELRKLKAAQSRS